MTDWVKLLPDGQPSYTRDDVVYEALKAETAMGFSNQERSTNEVATRLMGAYPDTLPNKIARQRLYMALAKIAKLEKWTRQGPPVKSRFGIRRPWLWGMPAPDRPDDLALAEVIVAMAGAQPGDWEGEPVMKWALWVLAQHDATTKAPDHQP